MKASQATDKTGLVTFVQLQDAIPQATHDAIVAAKDAEIAKLKKDLVTLAEEDRGYRDRTDKLLAEFLERGTMYNERLQEIIKYAAPHKSIMWAQYVTGLATGKDWRDA